MRVLLIEASPLGDVIRTLPVLADAARAISGIQLGWVVEEGSAEVPAWHPAVARVVPAAIWRWHKNLWQTLRNGKWWRFKQHLKEVDYDLVIGTQGPLKSAWLTRYMGKIPITDFGRDSAREPLASRFYRHAYLAVWGQYAAERTCQLFAQVLGYPLPESAGDYGPNHEQLTDADPDAPYLVFLYGTTRITKHWSEACWYELVERMCERGWSMRLLQGSAAEREQAGRPAVGLENTAVLPRLSLTGMAKVLAGACACMAMDTGLGHLAATLDVPTPSLSGPTNPGFTGAYGRSQTHLGNDFPYVLCPKETCTYQPTEEDHKLFGLKREQPLCFIRLNPQRVVIQLEVMLLAPETFR